MADNRYNVDDILREVKEKRAREERAAQTGKRPPATPEDLLRQLETGTETTPKIKKFFDNLKDRFDEKN